MNRFNRLLVGAVLFAGIFICASLRAQDEQYVRIYNQIQEADNDASASQPLQALNKYLAAQSDLQQFQKVYPEWNTRIVSFRLNFLADKISGLSGKVPATARSGTNAPSAAVTSAADAASVPSAETARLRGELNELHERIRSLQSDNALLQAKVREAFAAQPSAVDARELEKAEGRIQSLEKENDLLKATLTQERAAKPGGESKDIEQLKQQLAEANRALSQESARARSIATEKAELQEKLAGLSSAAASTQTETLKQALAEASRNLAAQTKVSSLLQTDKAALEKQIADLQAGAQTAAALREENALLKKQLAEARSAPAAPSDATRQLAAAQAQIAAIQSDKEVLRLENVGLKQQVKELTLANVTLAGGSDKARVKQLERERDDLQERLARVETDLTSRRNRAVTAQLDDLRNEIELLRTRLAVLQAPAVPYTKDELALFDRHPEQLSAAVTPGFEKTATSELPSGSLALVKEAQRDFAIGRYTDAEAKYLRVLKQDENNVYTLANLSAIELELDHLDAADKHITKALALSPNDTYSLSVLGNLRFRQGKTDEAMDALARAAKLDPKNAEIQNHLGLVLSKKGLRKEAETALRTAIELDPNYASAHNNLAVIYITQQPPSPALARWHYEKARKLGMPANPQLEKLLDQSSKTASATP